MVFPHSLKGAPQSKERIEYAAVSLFDCLIARKRECRDPMQLRLMQLCHTDVTLLTASCASPDGLKSLVRLRRLG
jgi:hypothetical protein|tara:strand:+ start:182 stop:406 length:225 start_codon:yes stop_codon:yes gene_type:complete